MTPTTFPQANANYGPPADYTEEQVKTIPAWEGQELGGPLDGVLAVVVAWQPSEEDLAALNEGAPIFLRVIGGLPPHSLSTEFPYNIPS